MVKISAGAENWASAEILTSHAGTTGRYSAGETSPIKAERPEPSDHLSTCTRINTIYEDLNESSSARLGGSQQLEILPSPNSKKSPNFSAWILIGAEGNFAGAVILLDAEISTSALVLSYIVRRMNFVFPQKFSAEVFSRSFPQKFSTEVFHRSFPKQISA
jgi:hypothetical protein